MSGAQDFLPDYEQVAQWHSVYAVCPKYSPLFTAMRKAKEWLHNARVREKAFRHHHRHHRVAVEVQVGHCWPLDR